MVARRVQLAVIATSAGAFSGLFGVGGGAVIVPLLVLWLGFGEREATGTSLAAIPLIAVLGAVLQGLHGNVDLAAGVLVGMPAVAGVVAGAAIQQRLSPRIVSGMFALLLLGSAAVLVF
jgi:uncharacterized membrane protein YfcA